MLVLGVGRRRQTSEKWRSIRHKWQMRPAKRQQRREPRHVEGGGMRQPQAQSMKRVRRAHKRAKEVELARSEDGVAAAVGRTSAVTLDGDTGAGDPRSEGGRGDVARQEEAVEAAPWDAAHDTQKQSDRVRQNDAGRRRGSLAFAE
jgi:hypothetical protein